MTHSGLQEVLGIKVNWSETTYTCFGRCLAWAHPRLHLGSFPGPTWAHSQAPPGPIPRPHLGSFPGPTWAHSQAPPGLIPRPHLGTPSLTSKTQPSASVSYTERRLKVMIVSGWLGPASYPDHVKVTHSYSSRPLLCTFAAKLC